MYMLINTKIIEDFMNTSYYAIAGSKEYSEISLKNINNFNLCYKCMSEIPVYIHILF